MMCRILSTGYDQHLMAVRSMVLQHAGHCVTAAYSIDHTLQLLQRSEFDLVLICHTLTPADHRQLIEEAHHKRTLPVICLTAREGESYADCVNAVNSPDSLLDAIDNLGLPLHQG